MKEFQKFDNYSDLAIAMTALDNTWSDKATNQKEKEYDGRAYVIVESKTRTDKTVGKTILGLVAVVGTLGFGLLSKNIRNLFTGKEVERFGLVKDKAQRYNELKSKNALYEDMTADKINRLEAVQINKLFPKDSLKAMEHTKEEIASLDAIAFKALLPKLNNSLYYKRTIPDNHLNDLDFENLTIDQIHDIFDFEHSDPNYGRKRVAQLNEENFKLLLPRLTFLYQIIPDKYLNEIDFNNIDEYQIKKIFDIPGNKNECEKIKIKMARAALLNEDNFKILLTKMDNSRSKEYEYGKFCEFIPESYFKHLDFKKMTKFQLGCLFQIDVKWPSSSYEISSGPLSGRQLSDETKARFASLSPAQILDMIDRELAWLIFGNPELITLFTPGQLENKKLKEEYDKLVVDLDIYIKKQNEDFKEKYHYQENFSPSMEAASAKSYEVLGIPLNSSNDVAKKAFYKLSRIYHPDRIKKDDNESDEDFTKRQNLAAEDFKKILSAYERITK